MMIDRELTEAERVQRMKLDARLKGRAPPQGWQRDVGVPHFPEDDAHGEQARGKHLEPWN